MPVVVRSSVGSLSGQWARRNGFVPGMIYGGPPSASGSGVAGAGARAPARSQAQARLAPAPVLTYSREADLRREISARKTSFLNTLFEVEVDGSPQLCLPRDVQLHPFKPKIIAVNWLRYVPGRYPGVRLGLPLVPINEERCPGLREGGWLLELMLKVPVFVHGPEVPEALYMDLRGKRVGDKVMASELDLAPGVVLRSRERDFAVAKIVGSRRGGASAGEEEEPAKVKVNEKKEKEKTSTLEKK
jgi:large subunit ribosomal protein L25